ncbi:MAG: hypothetical protein ABR564_02900, partial [Candidatus Dormibacteria bacterium]
MSSPSGLPELAPVVAVVLLAEFAAGTIIVTYLLDALERVGRGFAGTTALICAVVMGVDLVVAANLPETGALLHGPVAVADVASLIHWSVALTLMLLGFSLFCLVGTDPARHVIGGATVLVAVMVLITSAIAFGPPLGGALIASAVFLPAALLAGSATAGMLLGHWYLISPDLSFRPLRRAVYLIFTALAVQAVCIGSALLLSRGAGRDELLGPSFALPFWLLVVGSGVVFTGGVNVLTLYFARLRANQPATAMLY